ncbi:MAG TPA: hypothetical protein VFB06_34195 [Streptosporangiaceae bacterium]|nr:hypothetical protein [Streptosporangiaceae bacterium]
MGLLSWIRENWAGGKRGTLVENAGRDSPRIADIKEAAAEDVAAVEQDDKYFSKDSPANEDDL